MTDNGILTPVNIKESSSSDCQVVTVNQSDSSDSQSGSDRKHYKYNDHMYNVSDLQLRAFLHAVVRKDQDTYM